MHIPLVLPLQLLENAIQSRIKDIQDWIDTDEGASAFTEVEVSALGKIQLSSDEGKLLSQLPLQISARIRRDRRFIPNIPSLEKVDMKISVLVSTSLALSSDWKVQASSEASYEWQEKPSWGGGLIKLPLQSFVAPFLERELQGVAQQVDHFIAHEVNLNEALWESWTLLQNPIEIETDWDRPLFLKLNLPKQVVKASSIIMEKDHGKVIIKLDLPDNHVRADSKQEAFKKPSFLPQYAQTSLNNGRQQLRVRTRFTREDLEAILDQMEFPVDLRTRIKLKNTTLQLQDRKDQAIDVALKTDLFGRSRPFKLNGKLLVKCSLAWNSEEESFVLNDFSYQLLKGNAILRFVSLIRKQAIKREICSSVKMELNSQWQKARMSIWESLTHFDLNEFVELHTQKLEVNLTELKSVEGGVDITLELAGEPRLDIVKLDF